jgi:hypothetical protein
MIEAPRFLLAVFVGGLGGMTLFWLIRDGGSAVIGKQAQAKAAAPAPPPVAEPEPEPEPAAPARAERPLRPLKKRT